MGKSGPTAGTRLRFKKQKRTNIDSRQRKKLPSLKNRIRGLQRFLKKTDLEDEVRKAKTEELKKLEEEQKNKVSADKEREIAIKAKPVKFFDRRNLMRKLRSLRGKIQSLEKSGKETDELKTLKEERSNAEDDMKYVFLFPKGVEYIALSPRKPLPKSKVEERTKIKEDCVSKFDKNASDEQTKRFKEFCFGGKKDSKSDTSNRKRDASAKKADRKSKKRKAEQGAIPDDLDDSENRDTETQVSKVEKDNSQSSDSDGEEKDDFFL